MLNLIVPLGLLLDGSFGFRVKIDLAKKFCAICLHIALIHGRISCRLCKCLMFNSEMFFIHIGSFEYSCQKSL